MLTLYHLDYCPYCHRVRRAAELLGVQLKLVEIREQPWAREKLLTELGRATVPVLGIPQEDGAERLLPKSADIIEWLRSDARRVA